MNPEIPPTAPKANIIHEGPSTLGPSKKTKLRNVQTIEIPNNIDDILVTLAKVIKFSRIIFTECHRTTYRFTIGRIRCPIFVGANCNSTNCSRITHEYLLRSYDIYLILLGQTDPAPNTVWK